MSFFSFPNQRIPESKKTKKWHIEHIQKYLDYSGTEYFSELRKEMIRLFYVAESKLDPEKEKVVKRMITECYGTNFGPKYEVYPLVETMIEQLLGQYRDRPIRRRAIVKNEEAVMRKLDEKVSMIAESWLREANKEISDELGFEPMTENPDLEIPENIEEYFEKDYRSVSEETAENILHQVLVVRKGKEKLINALYYYLVCQHSWVLFDIKDGHPYPFIPHPLDCFSDINPMEEIQDDIKYFVWDKSLSINDIFNTFDLTEKQKLEIESYAGQAGKENNDGEVLLNDKWFSNTNGFRIRVISKMWVSRRQVVFKVITNKETGAIEYKIMPDDYKFRNRDNEEDFQKIEIDDIRHITMCGPNVVLSYGRVNPEEQLKNVADFKKRWINAIGISSGNKIAGDTGIRSLAKKLEWLQDFASDVIYELKLSLNYIDGSAIVYDTSSIPKEFLRDNSFHNALNKVKYHLKKDRMLFVNRRDKNQGSQANSVNISQSKRMQDILVLLSTIEQLAEKISGVNENMQGQGNSYEKASVAEMRLGQASARVENYFGVFDSFIDVACERMCIFGKHVYKENQVFNYFSGDSGMRFLQIFPDYFLDDLGIYFDDNRKEMRKKQMIEQMASETFARSQFPEMLLYALQVFKSDTSNDAEDALRRGLKTLEKIRAENEKAAREAEQRNTEMLMEDKEKDRNIKREGYQKDIAVAHIYQRGKQENEISKQTNENMRAAAKIEAELLKAGVDNSKSKD